MYGLVKHFKCGRICNRKKDRNKATPLPKVKVIVIGSIVFINNFGAAFIFPFLPFMVHDFFPQLNKDELGRQAGFLGSAFFAGSFVGSLLWGWISDIWGRRPVMLVGILGTIFSELLFGFSQNFAWAIIARFSWGLLNGNIGVAKTYLSEICDDTNQAQGFSVIGTSSGIGRLLGSVVGGYLAQPASKYPFFQHEFFCQFPYILPVFVAVAVGIFSLFSGFCFLGETLHKSKDLLNISQTQFNSTTNEPDNTNNNDDSGLCDSTDIEMVSLTSESEAEENSVVVDSDIDGSDVELLINAQLTVKVHDRKESFLLKLKRKLKNINIPLLWKKFLLHHKLQCIACCYCCWHKSSDTKSKLSAAELCHKILSRLKMMLKLMIDRRVILSTGIYGLLGFMVIITNELFPLLMVTDHVHGGFEMDDNEIATFVMIVSVVQLLYQPIVFPRLAKLLGYRNLLRVSLLLFATGSILLPWCNSITGPIDPVIGGSGSGSGSGSFNDTVDYCGRLSSESPVNENSITRIPAKVWAIVLLSLLMQVIARVSGFTSIMVMVNNSALQETRGTVNGIGQSLVAIARSIGPSVGSLLFAWSEANGLNWPLNYHLTFLIVSIGAIVTILVSFLLPKSIEKKREHNS